MTSRRKLKKQINASMEILYNDCLLYKVFRKDADIEKADKIIDDIATIHADLLSRVSISEGREADKRVKNYYKKLNEDLKSQVNRIGLEIQGLG